MRKNILIVVAVLCWIEAISAQHAPPLDTTAGSQNPTSSWPFTPSIGTTGDSTVEVTTSTQSTTTTTRIPRGPCDDHIGEIILDPQNCSKYIVCSSTVNFYFYCPLNTIFNASQTRCIAGDSVSCTARTTTDMCTETFFGAFPHPTDQRRYVACIKYGSLTMMCDGTQIFEPAIGKCV